MRNKKQNGIKLPPQCGCGRLAVKKFGDVWSCQRCLDLDRIVTEIHKQHADQQMKVTQSDAYRKMQGAKTYGQYHYYKTRYML